MTQAGLGKRVLRTKDDLRSDSKTLRYELENLLNIAELCSPEFAPQIKSLPPLNNALVEAFALHCRAIISFLFGHSSDIEANGKTERFSKPRENDVLAIDFYPEWDEHCPSANELILQAKWQADKHVAHITTDRREVNQPGSKKESVWKISDSTNVICGVMGQFLSSAPAENFDPMEIRRMRELIDSWQIRRAARNASSAAVTTPTVPVRPVRTQVRTVS